jgi:hypothetical protein
MTREINKSWIELIGLTALVVSLIFVGLELKLGRDVAVAGQYQDRASLVADYYLSRLESEHLIAHLGVNMTSDYEADLLGPEQKSHFESRGPDSLAINFLHMNVVLVMLDNLHFQFQQGFITQEAWIPFRSILKGALRDALWAELFLANPIRWRESFRDLCLELLAEIEAEETSRD